MLENRIKISSIIENQLPEFIREEYPLVSEFLSQYYLSLESQGSASDIIQNIDNYIKIDNLTNLTEFTNLNADLTLFDTEILVDSTEGFPDSYGLLLIDDEIITYTNKTSSSFLGCIRGFSGITSLKDNIREDQLIFTESESSEHLSIVSEEKTKVFNLSILFLKEFFIKIKKQIVPGLENKDFYESLNERLFIKQSNNLYTSKGTEGSFKILFGALYGVIPKIILPRDYLIQPSDAQFRVTQDLVVESVSGDPLELINGTLYQDKDSSGIFSDSRGTISDVKRISRNGKIYYTISLDSGYDKDIDVFGSIKSDFKIHPKTILTSRVFPNLTYLDVDSTIGFPDSGELVVDLNLEGDFETRYIITYTSKVINQFLGCSGIPSIEIPEGTEVKINNYAYGFNSNNEEVRVRITGVISGIDSFNTNAYYEQGDVISIKTLGEDCKGVRENNWFFNISTNYDIKSIEDLSPTQNTNILDLKITLFDNHNFVKGDELEIFFSTNTKYYGIVSEINNSKQIISKVTKINPENEQEFPSLSLASKIRKRISKLNVNQNTVFNSDPDTIETYKTYNTNVQNTYIDFDNSLYVSSSSLPSYLNTPINIDDFSYRFVDVTLPESNEIIVIDSITTGNSNVLNHSYYTGDAIIFRPSPESNIKIDGVGLTTSVYYVKVEDTNTIKLSRSKENIFKENYITITGNLNQSRLELLRFADVNLNSFKLKSQNLFKKITKTELVSDRKETDNGTTGIFVNGVELLNYKSTDKIFYGPIEEIVVTSQGNDYDVINPPQLSVTDLIGTGCNAYCSVIGELKRIDVIDPGFDYIEEPKITISGGNGFGAQAKVRLIDSINSPEFNSQTVDITNNIIDFSEHHRFKNYERVIYTTNNQKSVLGINTNSEYYVSIVDSFKVKLHNSLQDAISGINTVIFYEEGFGVHSFRSTSSNKKISSVEIISSGIGYQNKKTKISGISTASDTLTIVNHGYSDGEIIVYYPQNSPIVGLTSSQSYYVTKISNNEVKLSETGPDNNPQLYFNNKKYINFTINPESFNHYFNYPPITVILNGKVGTSSTLAQEYYGKVVPVFRGKIQSVFVENGGVGYGSPDIINFDRQPSISLLEGSGAQLTPIIDNGAIKKVIIQSPGLNYKGVPDIIINGDGFGAVLVPVVSNGSIVEVKVISGGFGYTQKGTFLSVLVPGNNAKFKSIIKSWRINLVEKYIKKEKIYSDDGIIINGLNGLQYVHLYPSRSLRSSVYLKTSENTNQNYIADLQLDTSNKEINSIIHSPIIGWAYDGNPIYGPYGFASGNSGPIKLMKSGYTKKSTRLFGPSAEIYPLGFFIEDYEFTNSGDLDESNGRYCKTPEFPDGTYAYFSTFTERTGEGPFLNYKTPVFPYVIGNFYRSEQIQFNFNQQTILDETIFGDKKLLRNTTPYNLLNDRSGYEYIPKPFEDKKQDLEVEFTTSGTIDFINIVNPGDDYKVRDPIIFDDGFINGRVTKIKGKNISSITSYTTTTDIFEFYPYEITGEFIGISSVPHNLYNNSLVTLTSKYEYKKVDRIQVIQNTLSLAEDVNDVNVTGFVTSFRIYGDLDFIIKENDLYSIGSEVVKILNVDRVNYQLRVLRSVNSSISTSHSAGDELTSLSRKVIFNTGITSNFHNYRANDEYYFDPKISVGLGLTSGVGISSTLFFSVNAFNTPITIEKGVETTIYFKNQSDISKYSSGGYVDIVNASNVEYNTTRKEIVSIGSTLIKIDFDSSSFPGTVITANLNKWNVLNIPTKSIYLPKNRINTNDKLIYNSYEGSPISISIDSVNSFELESNSVVYAVRLSDDLIGISTQPVSINEDGEVSGIGTTTNSIVYFSGIGTNTYHSFKTDYPNILSGVLSQNISIVSTSEPHELTLEEIVDINVESGISTTIKLIYNEENRRFVVNPRIVEDINLENNTLQISNHKFKTGEKLIYTEDSPIGGLVNNKMYYAVIIDTNTIGLCDNLFESRKELPNLIDLTSLGQGKLSLINPRIEIIKYQDIIFDVSDSSLSYGSGQLSKSAFDLKLFYDKNFKNEFGTFDLIKSGSIGIGSTSTITLKTKNLPNDLYYSLIPIDLLNTPPNKKEIYIDKEQIEHNKILLINSEIQGKQQIIDYTTNTFLFNTTNPVESLVYDSDNSIISYETDSPNTSGGISKVSVNNSKKLYKKVPKVKEIISENGSGAILEIFTSTIGNVSSNNVKIKDIGFNYSLDTTVRPKCIFPSILKILPFNTFDYIEVTSRGKNYISNPDLIVLDGITNEVVDDVQLKYDIDSNKVSIIQNTKGISELEPSIIPINNDNGFLINDIFYDNISKDVTVILEGQYNDPSTFPFSIGEEVLIENVSVESENDKGYNSENYGYRLFKIKTLTPNFGGSGANFTYSLENLLGSEEIPGDYDTRFSKGTVIPKNYLPEFNSNLKVIEFSKDETVVSSNNSGIVKGWDNENNYLKVISNKDFTVGDILVGQSSNVKAIIENIISFDTYLDIKSNATVKQGWKLETGFLNNNNQRIYDSDYYQYFSYSVESPIDINKWNDVVGNITHTSGFKRFSDLLVQDENFNTGISTSQDLGNYYSESVSSEFINFNCVHDFDLVSENYFITNNKIKSNEIYFDSRILQDYIESIGNRVLVIDDISDKFTTTEPRNFQVIDNFELADIRYKKYFVYVYDILDPTRSECLLVSLLHDDVNGFLNQYAIISSEDSLGYFDFQTEIDRFGQLLYYPSITERKIYKYNTFSFGIGDTLVGVGNTTLEIGDIAKIQYVNTIIAENETDPISLPGISTSQRSYKILITISDKEDSYYQFDEISLLHNNTDVLINDYGDLNNTNFSSSHTSGIVTFSSSIESNELVLKLHPSVGVGNSLFVNAIITSIDSTNTTEGSLDILGNDLTSNFISTSMTGGTPEEKLVFNHSTRYSATYNIILIEDKTNNKFEFIEMTTLLNNSIQESLVVEYGVLNFDGSIGEFTSEINNTNGNFELYFTPYEDISYEIKILSSIIGINSQDGVTTV
jgi:hypothetical protein